MSELKTVDAHLEDILTAVGPLAEIDVHLLEAHGCVLAEDIRAPGPLPGFENSAMDGYAVIRADLATPGVDGAVRPVPYSDIYAVQPFGNTITLVTMTGELSMRV